MLIDDINSVMARYSRDVPSITSTMLLWKTYQVATVKLSDFIQAFTSFNDRAMFTCLRFCSKISMMFGENGLEQPLVLSRLLELRFIASLLISSSMLINGNLRASLIVQLKLSERLLHTSSHRACGLKNALHHFFGSVFSKSSCAAASNTSKACIL